MSLCYSKLYYGSQVWLLPTLKESLYKSLLSQSGQCLKLLNRDLSYVNLHKKYLRATPKLFSHNHTAVNYYKAINERIYFQEAPDLINDVLSDGRNLMLTFVRRNNYKIGLNLQSNRLHSISNCIPQNSLSLSKPQFKTFCKVNIIQKGLTLL